MGTAHPTPPGHHQSALERVVASGLFLNGLGEVHTQLAAPLGVDHYAGLRPPGTSLLLDHRSAVTGAAGLLRGVGT